jgi:5-methyltetrahydrofolate--homocysteine methyltransferase
MRIIHNLKAYKNKRKYLRNNSTKAEIMLWKELKNSKIGFKFRRQHGIKNYIVDFYCSEKRLIIEIDGEVHNINKQVIHDKIREEYLKSLNFKIIRYNNYDIANNLDLVLQDIKKQLC